MKKGKIIIACISFLVLLFFASCSISSEEESAISAPSQDIDMSFPGEFYFDIDDFEEEIEDFSTWRLRVDPIRDEEDAAAKADVIFKERYPESSLERQRPYVVLYDEEADAWLIRGQWRKEGDGGSAYMIVRSDGKVIAVWHDL